MIGKDFKEGICKDFKEGICKDFNEVDTTLAFIIPNISIYLYFFRTLP